MVQVASAQGAVQRHQTTGTLYRSRWADTWTGLANHTASAVVAPVCAGATTPGLQLVKEFNLSNAGNGSAVLEDIDRIVFAPWWSTYPPHPEVLFPTGLPNAGCFDDITDRVGAFIGWAKVDATTGPFGLYVYTFKIYIETTPAANYEPGGKCLVRFA